MEADAATRAAVLHVLDELNRCVAGRDLEATLALFAPDDGVLLLGSEEGELAIGASELRAFFTRLYARPAAYSWNWSSRYVSRAGDVAWALADGEVMLTDPAGRRTGSSRLTLVLVYSGGRWTIAQIHHSEPIPAYAPS